MALPEHYDAKRIEARWQERWQQRNVYRFAPERLDIAVFLGLAAMVAIRFRPASVLLGQDEEQEVGAAAEGDRCPCSWRCFCPMDAPRRLSIQHAP